MACEGVATITDKIYFILLYFTYAAGFRQGHVPNRWKLATVVPVPKVHPPKDKRSNMRLISLTPTLAIFFESLVGGHGRQTWQRPIWSTKTLIALISMTH